MLPADLGATGAPGAPSTPGGADSPASASAPVAGASLGVARLSDQTAAPAGTIGTLDEVAILSLWWRTGRIVLEAGGTFWFRFREEATYAAPLPGVAPATGGRRRSAGDFRVATTVRLTPERARVTGFVRFGTRLPTADNTSGLERDQTDFFATLGLAGTRGPVALHGEVGVGIHGTRVASFEQDDLLLYALRAERRTGRWRPTLTVLGQLHGYKHPAFRGLDDLGEARLGVTWGGARWLRIEGVRGHATASPSRGLILTAGARW